MSKVILDVAEQIKKLRYAIARLTVAEVDMFELLGTLVAILQERDQIDENFHRFCQSYSSWGSKYSSPTNDGIRLVEELQRIFSAMRAQYKVLGLWDSHGLCSYVMDRMVGDNIVITDPYSLDAMSDEEYEARQRLKEK